MIDTHTHLYDEAFKDDIDEVIKKAQDKGITNFYLPNCDLETIQPMFDLCDCYPNVCKPMLGLHPCYVKEDFQSVLDQLYSLIKARPYAAIGEIGLDYHWDMTFVEQQKSAFEQQIDWALEMDLPIVIHSRSSTKDCIEIVRKKQNGQLKGIFHCYGDDVATANEIIDLGFKIGIGGVVTFKNSNLGEVIKAIDLQHIVLETDAPYLAPVPFRGKRNDSSMLSYVCDKIADFKGISGADVDEITTKNAIELYKL